MTDKLLIEREMLEQVASEFEHDNDRYMLGRELRAILTAPRQPEGEGLEVVAFYWLDTGYENPNSHGPYFGWPNEDALRRVDGGAMPIALCRLSDAKRVIAELRELIGAAQRVTCAVIAERNTLRQLVDERDAEIEQLKEESFEGLYNAVIDQRDKLAGLLREARELIDHGDFREGHCMCGSGVEGHSLGDGHVPVDAGEYYAGQVRERIDAALAEVKK